MPRVAILSPLPPQRTGESEYTLQLIRALVQTSGIAITAITGKDAREIPSADNRIETLRIWDGRSIFYPFTVFRALKKRRIALAHIQFGPHGMVYGGAFGEIMLALLLLLRLGGIRTTVTMHSTWMPNQVVNRVKSYPKLKYFSAFARAGFHLYMKLFELGSDTIQLSTVKLNSSLKDEFLKEYSVDPLKVLEIPHPCRGAGHLPTRNDALESIGLPEKEVILIFGFVRRGKGIEYAIRAMSLLKKECPDAVLVIAGSTVDDEGNKYLTQLRSLTAGLDLKGAVVFNSKYIDDEDTKAYFASASIILVPYTTSVGASAPIHSYASLGIPIVASDVGHHMHESLGQSLVLFRNRDSTDLAEKLTALLKDEAYRKQVGNTHKEYAKRENWERCAARTLRYYEKTTHADT